MMVKHILRLAAANALKYVRPLYNGYEVSELEFLGVH